MAVLLPQLIGGCPEYRNSVVDTAENATFALLTCEDPEATLEAAGTDLLSATLTLFFDLFRTDESRNF
jgi:hypothetical protein